MADDMRDRFSERYRNQDTPWDTGITPPEIVAICAELPPGKALDLGCGTGTTLHHLLQHGWQVDGIDFAPEAIQRANIKLKDFPAEAFFVQCYDVTRLDHAHGLRTPYDLVIDIGCGHNLQGDKADKYAHDITMLLAPGGTLMLYAHAPTEDRPIGWTADDVRRIFTPYLDIVWQVLSDDTTTGRPSGWYRMRKTA